MEKYKTRTIEKSLNFLIDKCPVIMIAGPRQVGKTTLLNHLKATSKKKINYISFDNVLLRTQAREDPELFLRTYETPIIIDEFQYVPELLSYIKIKVDKARENEMFGDGKEVGTMELNDAVFGVEINDHLVHLAVVRQLANNRQGTQKAKTRSEVSGGGRKPWRQKGTGHARQGSIRAPQWTGGGVVFAPVPRDYEVKMNKKERRAALKSALTSKVQDNKLVVVDSLALAEVKTKEMQKVLTNLKAEKALVITADNDQNVILSARNIADVETATPATINTYDVMKHNTVVVTKDAVASIEEVYA